MAMLNSKFSAGNKGFKSDRLRVKKSDCFSSVLPFLYVTQVISVGMRRNFGLIKSSL